MIQVIMPQEVQSFLQTGNVLINGEETTYTVPHAYKSVGDKWFIYEPSVVLVDYDTKTYVYADGTLEGVVVSKVGLIDFLRDNSLFSTDIIDYPLSKAQAARAATHGMPSKIENL